ncbi:conserved hypothetical protein [Pseudomonas sp. 8BK]|uniref:hypothetical protein n=1 Tax=Pseudomonas sp. 8BK TaxID=2653164 RepID=UPI0012EEFC31|nr:hypothetical protein [Pseudomonas sp. 8BK]VXC19651.1 conserved hypothetical protein [Pseudomonas sp. 8BK]
MSNSSESNACPTQNSDGEAISERRAIIIKIITEHYLSGSTAKLKLVDIAERAGISRQALDRYYKDLKPFIAGKKDIADLVNGNETKSLIRTQSAVNETESKWKQRIREIEARHERQLESALNSHVTSLMNTDIALFESTTLRSTLEKHALHNAELKRQVQDLELSAGLAVSQRATATSPSKKLVFNVDIERFCASYQLDKDISSFEDKKLDAIVKIREKIKSFKDSPEVHVVIFAERYISDFQSFTDEFLGPPGEFTILVRLPLFSRSEVTGFLKHVPTEFKRSIHIPFQSSEATKKAHRSFFYKNPLPDMEIKGADTADNPVMSWGFDSILSFKV